MIQKRKLKSGEVRYDVRLRRPDGSHYVKTFRTKKEAETYKATEMADRARGTWIDPKAGKILFADWSAEWLKTWTMTWRPRTADKHQMAMRVHWVPRFGGQEVGSITPRQVQAAVDELAVEVSAIERSLVLRHAADLLPLRRRAGPDQPDTMPGDQAPEEVGARETGHRARRAPRPGRRRGGEVALLHLPRRRDGPPVRRDRRAASL